MTDPTCACGCGHARPTGDGTQPVDPGTVLAGPPSAAVPASPLVQAGVSRRSVLTGSAAVVAGLALAACSSPADTATTPTPTPTPLAPSPTTPKPGSDKPNETMQAPQGQPLTTKGDVALGGGVILVAPVGDVVVTHPSGDEFKAFDARCPHKGCTVNSVAGNVITCICHTSTFDAATGERLGGPAPTGLTPLGILVEGDAIYLA